MQYRFLVWDEKQNEVRLLGYTLRLSPAERQIIEILFHREFVTAEEFHQFSKPTISKASICTHIHAINKKAFAISGRKLIVFETDHYRFTAAM